MNNFLEKLTILIVLGFAVAIFVSIPLVISFRLINQKLDKIDTGVYNIRNTQEAILAPSSASSSATTSGKAK